MIGVGFVFVWKTDKVYNLLGYVPFAERYLSGGSRFFYKLVGLAAIFVGAMVVANLQWDFVGALFGKAIPGGG
jgi:uncharacterized membrane protein YuzA (DUF378 family)